LAGRRLPPFRLVSFWLSIAPGQAIVDAEQAAIAALG
jgi:hypothetical protein